MSNSNIIKDISYMNDLYLEWYNSTALEEHVFNKSTVKNTNDFIKNLRHGRTRQQHIELVNKNKELRRATGETIMCGSPSKKDMILEYKANHPEASVRTIASALGCSKTTVQKWIGKKK